MSQSDRGNGLGAAAGVATARGGPAPGWRVRWAGRSAVAVTDQALFAGTNFLVSVFLARQLDAAGYGAFALAQAAFWLLSAAYGAVLTEPMTVFGAGKYADDFAAYLTTLSGAHWRLALPVTIVTALAGLICGHALGRELGQALLGLALAAPLLLLALMGRAANYARLRPSGALFGSVLYSAMALLLMLFLHIRGWLTPLTAFLALGAGGAVAGVATLSGLTSFRKTHRLHLRSIAAEHWGYGRWALATAGASWIPLNVYFVVLPAWAGLAAGAGLKALTNIAQPALHTLLALTSLMLPALVRRRQAGGGAGVVDAALRFLVVFLGISVCYAGALWLLRERVFDLLYGGRYSEYVSALLWVGLMPIAASSTVVLGSVLRALERLDLVFRSCATAAAVALSGGLVLTTGWGAAGAAGAMVMTYLVNGTVMFWLCLRLRRHEPAEWARRG